LGRQEILVPGFLGWLVAASTLLLLVLLKLLLSLRQLLLSLRQLLLCLCYLPQDLILTSEDLGQGRIRRWRWRWWRSLWFLITIGATTFALVKATRRAARTAYHLQKRQIGQSGVQIRAKETEQGLLGSRKQLGYFPVG
jgi:hypothetical protein